MIIWVDEDTSATEVGARRLKRRGYQTELIVNATDGLNRLKFVLDERLTLAIIDVGLVPGDDTHTFCKSNPLATATMGVELVKLLTEHKPKFPWAKKFVFFSRSTDPKVVAFIQQFADKHDILYIKKDTEMTSKKFVRLLVSKGFIN